LQRELAQVGLDALRLGDVDDVVDVGHRAGVVDREQHPQRALALDRHVVRLDQRLADIDEDLGLARAERVSAVLAACRVVVNRKDVLRATMALVDGDGLGSK